MDVRSQRDEESYGHLTGHTHITASVFRFPQEAKTSSDSEQVVDWSNESDDESANVRIDFSGERLKEWLQGEAGHRGENDEKPSGVRWSELANPRVKPNKAH